MLIDVSVFTIDDQHLKVAHVFKMSSSYGVYDSRCPSPHLSPFENKIGGYPVSRSPLSPPQVQFFPVGFLQRMFAELSTSLWELPRPPGPACPTVLPLRRLSLPQAATHLLLYPVNLLGQIGKVERVFFFFISRLRIYALL